MSEPLKDKWIGLQVGNGRYTIAAKLGEGGMGSVYRAWDSNLKTDVVVKIPHAAGQQDPDVTARFVREASSLVKLTHPHIVKIIDFGEQEGQPFAVMQFLSGGSLATRQEADTDGGAKRQSPNSLREWLPSVATALDFVHSQGYLHRDVKPANILFDAHGNAFLSDFGITKFAVANQAAQSGKTLTGAGMVLGTPEYMAPELILGKEADGRVDQYGLAVTVFESLAGRRPFEDATATAVLVQQTTKEPPDIRSFNSGVPKAVAEAIQRALSKDPAQRFPNCRAFAEAISKALSPVDTEKGIHAKLKCPACGRTLKLTDKLRGRTVPCPACNSMLTISDDLDQIVLRSSDYQVATGRGGTRVFSPIAAVGGSNLAASDPPSQERLSTSAAGGGAESSSSNAKIRRTHSVALADIETQSVSTSKPHRKKGSRGTTGRVEKDRVPPKITARIAIATGAAGILLVAAVIFYVVTNRGTVRISIKGGTDASIQVTVDGDEIAVKGLNEPLTLRVGDHNLVVSSPSYETVTRHFTVRRASTEIVEIDLTPESRAPQTATAGNDFRERYANQTYGGTIRRVNGKWEGVENKTGIVGGYYSESSRTKDYVELVQLDRNLPTRLYADHIEQKLDGKWSHVARGHWETPSNAKPQAVAHGSKAPVPQMPQIAPRSENRPVEEIGAARLPGSLVFESSLSTADTLETLYCAFGQYGGRAVVEPGSGLRLISGHTAPMVWAKPFLGERYRAEFEVQLKGAEWAGWALNGPGYGNSPESGYFCRLDRTTFWLQRERIEAKTTRLPRPLAPGEWASVQADVSGGNIAVTVNGLPITQFSDAEPLTGPLHGRFGLVAWGNAIFRNLRIRSSATDTSRERQLTPPVTEKPLANGDLLYELNLTAGELGPEWWKSQPGNVAVENGILVFSSANNGTPSVVLTKPLPHDLACEVEFEYPSYDAVNFNVHLWFAKKPPQSSKDYDGGWLAALPMGDGKSTVFWRSGPKDNREGELTSVGSTPYYAPISQRKYLARIESYGDDLRVFLDGGLLLAAKRPSGAAAPATPVFLGLHQFYGGSKIHAVRVYKIGTRGMAAAKPAHRPENRVVGWKLARTVDSVTPDIYSIGLSSDGSLLGAGGADQHLRIWDLRTGTLIRDIRRNGSETGSVTFFKDGRRVLCTVGRHRKVEVWDLKADKSSTRLRNAPSSRESRRRGSLKQSPSFARDRAADANEPILQFRNDPNQEIWRAALSRDEALLATGGKSGVVTIWDVATALPLRQMQHGLSGATLGLAFSPDGKQIAVASTRESGRVALCDVATGNKLTDFEGHSTVAFSGDGRYLSCNGNDGTIRLWDISTHDLKRSFGSGIAGAFACSPDGRWIAAAANGATTIQIWDVERETEPQVLEGDSEAVTQVAFNAQGRRVAAASRNKVIRVWEAVLDGAPGMGVEWQPLSSGQQESSAEPSAETNSPPAITIDSVSGRWRLVDDNGSTTCYFTLTKDRRARKSHVPDATGKWVVVGNEVRITWSDAWRDVMRFENGRVTKFAFAPGTSWRDKPANIEHGIKE